MKRLFTALMLCIGICILMGLCPSAFAEMHYDLRGSTQDYCRMVAGLNAGLDRTDSVRGQSQMEMVLFITDDIGLNFDHAPFNVQCVVYGPDGFSVMLCDDSETAIEWLLSQNGVVCAEADSTVSACSSENPEDISFYSWGAEALGFGEYLTFAKQVGVGSATVAVVDSGVYNHSLINPKLIASGYDYVDNDYDSFNDLDGHGTHVAGIVADCTRGLPVYIYPIRVLDANGYGKMSHVISAVLEATAADVDVINLSLTSYLDSPVLETAIRDAIAAGTAVVAVAGNQSCDTVEITPAKMTDRGMIVVGSADEDGARSSFSNYGSSVDVYVYGRNIVSCSRSGGYSASSGTSMAAPHVSALSAMIRLVHPGASPENIEARIKAAAEGNIPIPAVGAMALQQYGFRLENISLRQDQQLRLPTKALPAAAMETIRYTSSDPEIVGIDDGMLSAKTVGTAQITASIRGIAETFFSVSVIQTPGGTAVLPQNLETIGEEAFYGLTTAAVEIPPGVVRIGDRAFDAGKIDLISVPETVSEIGENQFSGAVILCAENSAAHEYALEHELQYLIRETE